MSDDPDYVKTWNKFWLPICVQNGQVNMDQVMRELHDFHEMMESVSKVYDHISGGRLSKPNYAAEVMIAQFDDRVQEAVREALEEEKHSKVNHSS